MFLLLMLINDAIITPRPCLMTRCTYVAQDRFHETRRHSTSSALMRQPVNLDAGSSSRCSSGGGRGWMRKKLITQSKAEIQSSSCDLISDLEYLRFSNKTLASRKRFLQVLCYVVLHSETCYYCSLHFAEDDCA